MTAGSGLFSEQRGIAPYKTAAGKSGFAGEIGDLRRDIASTLAPMAAICVQEFTNPLATTTSNLMAATASQVTEDVLLPATTPAAGALTAATIANLATGGARQIIFTVAGSTPAHRAPTGTIYGTDLDGKPKTQTVLLPKVAGAATSGFFKDIEKIVLAAGTGTGATVALGLGAALGLEQVVKTRAGRTAVIQEVADGSVVTNGVVAAGGLTAATDTGTEDLSEGGTLATETLIVEVDGGAAQTVTFAAPATLAAVVAAIEAVIPGIASASDDNLKLTSPTTGSNSSLAISGTSLTKLGITAGFYAGSDKGNGTYTPNSALNGALDFALYYEFDAAA